ncbi:MAG TPA: hypothetical protein VGP96_04930, partial [Candidatus Dormibacteraeota bacterium]|nr:hypothetical protein [Candidatus Dormibacteraeota bacterium]
MGGGRGDGVPVEPRLGSGSNGAGVGVCSGAVVASGVGVDVGTGVGAGVGVPEALSKECLNMLAGRELTKGTVIALATA